MTHEVENRKDQVQRRTWWSKWLPIGIATLIGLSVIWVAIWNSNWWWTW